MGWGGGVGENGEKREFVASPTMFARGGGATMGEGVGVICEW